MEDGGGFGTGASFNKTPKGRRWGEVVKPLDYIYLGGGNKKSLKPPVLSIHRVGAVTHCLWQDRWRCFSRIFISSLFGERIQFDYSNIFANGLVQPPTTSSTKHWAFIIIPMVTRVYPTEPEPESSWRFGSCTGGQFVNMSHFLQVQTCKRWFGPGGPTIFLKI